MKLTDVVKEGLTRTGTSDSAVVGWGRGMGHKGHMYLASAVLSYAKEKSADPYFVLSRTQDRENPLSVKEKLAIYRKVFPKNQKVFQSATPTMPDLTQVLRRLWRTGYKNVTVVVGADQKDSLGYVMNYNGKNSKLDDQLLYQFDKLQVISRQETNDPNAKEEGPRATPMRQILLDPKATPEQKFKVWRDAMSPEINDDEIRALMKKSYTRIKPKKNVRK